ncbi:UBX domain-containing protein 5 [Escovopsis weberi]|uniref:UBX domain-containing protein 5 n=1 Tax=Escovopsis weberi TaxID=150374 RepID=A0A0M9VV99_ESCWE|nr:UBX domain-containing protein 5 [Escovopsis weberi]
MEESISLFMAITGAGRSVARGFLEITGDNFERAIELYFENPDLVGAGITHAPPARSGSNAGRQDASGVIHISSDDEDDNDMQFDDDLEISNSNRNRNSNNNNSSNSNGFDDGDDDDANERAAAVQAAAIAQEEADAAMAQRLQEEMYRDSGSGSHDVRAPIARTTETLVAPDPAWGMTGGLETSFLEHMRGGRRQPPSRGTGPFAQRIWTDGGSTSRAVGPAENGVHARRLEDLFRPPYGLMARLGWDEAREVGKEKKRWIMVNLQDMNDFNCQTLNRDIWKDQAVQELVEENFVFLQYDKDYPDSQEYVTFYFPNRGHENPDNYPHVSIVDPRTGEQVKVWSGRPFPGAREFHAELAEFLDRYSLAANSKNPVAKVAARKPAATVDVDRMTEDEMLEMALKNSLAGPSGGASSGVATPSIADPDALTRLRGDGPEAAGAFARISSTSPHAEPANDPATTTRIQFRHPSGRIIRRFGLRDSVRRAYEWLKAEPLEGKQGLVFELKKMPQGEDLIGSLDETIESAGLKQGTVMIEFITEG